MVEAPNGADPSRPYSPYCERNGAIIRERINGRRTFTAIGREYGISPDRVSQIVGRYERYLQMEEFKRRLTSLETS